MKRLSFLAALFGIGAAGQTKNELTRTTTLRWWRDANVQVDVKTGKLANGTCPVCGEMAEPFKPKIEDYSSLMPCAPSGGLSVCRSWTKEDLPKSRIVTCARCRVRFEQDAEGERGTR